MVRSFLERWVWCRPCLPDHHLRYWRVGAFPRSSGAVLRVACCGVAVLQNSGRRRATAAFDCEQFELESEL
jgi:hypothetical protein